MSVWRNTLDHFDAIKIGLTATPAAHTKAYFRDVVYRYEYSRAVREGYLVDYDVVNIKSNVRMDGVFLKEGETVQVVDPDTGNERLDQLEDEREFASTEVKHAVTSPDSNRKILEEVKRYALEHEQKYGRFPKTLIFAANDLPHTSHADQLVELAVEIFGRGQGFVRKITGRADRPLQEIRTFRNRPEPGIVVSVDLMSTGVDIPDLEFIVFLRPVKSRILFEQMLGRGTRKGEKHPDKSHFTVFDYFDGTGREYKPEDYLEAFARFVRENPARIEAIQILLDRPRDWSTAALKELREKLVSAPERFTVELLQKAHQIRYDKALVDIISMVKHAAQQQAALLTGEERVEKITQAILAKAFRGELVPTEAELARQEGRDYEPASVLLERIRAERAQAGDRTRPSGGRRPRSKKTQTRNKARRPVRGCPRSLPSPRGRGGPMQRTFRTATY
jgi:hypothetical protein